MKKTLSPTIVTESWPRDKFVFIIKTKYIGNTSK
jgi:hypothetical protein